MLVQPSSAAERVFSLLENSFSERQNSALEDYNFRMKVTSLIMGTPNWNNRLTLTIGKKNKKSIICQGLLNLQKICSLLS